MHGLRIASDVPLPEPATSFSGPVDLEIHRSEPGTIERIPDESIGIRYALDTDTVYYEGHCEEPGLWVLKAPGVVSITLRGARATVQLGPAVDPELMPMFAAGLGIGLYMALSGRLCLHASAVEADGRAVALSGPSGSGKSTLAALAAAAGHPLVGDDLLRVDLAGEAPDVYRGASEIRLRAGAAALTQHWPERSRMTADGRTAVAPPRTRAERLPLAALVFPVLDRERSDVGIERMRPADAFAALLTAPRILGWLDAGVVARQFLQLTALAAEVPILVARVPWRARAEPEMASTLVERVLSLV